jgi:uncharacterized protein YbjT (DUF2867 family)
MDNAPSTILVTGATGRIGRLVVAELLKTGVSVRALTRRPDQAMLLGAVEIVEGDFTVPASLERALHGGGPVFLLWTAPPEFAPAVIGRLASHASRVVLMSSPHQTPHPFFQQPNPMAAMQADIERLMAQSGIASTIIRPGIFASNARFWWAEMIRRDHTVRWPYAAAETAPIDERDVAAVIARALVDDRHAGKDYVLTEPQSLTQAEQVALIGEMIGHPIQFQELSPDEFRRETAGTWPPFVVDMLLNAWDATIGHRAFVTSVVADVLGSPARTFGAWAADHVEAFS